jgi:hypothetical protein
MDWMAGLELDHLCAECMVNGSEGHAKYHKQNGDLGALKLIIDDTYNVTVEANEN